MVTGEFKDIKLLRWSSQLRMKWPRRNTIPCPWQYFTIYSWVGTNLGIPLQSTVTEGQLKLLWLLLLKSLEPTKEVCENTHKPPWVYPQVWRSVCIPLSWYTYTCPCLHCRHIKKRGEPSLMGLDFYSMYTEPRTQCIQFKTKFSL